MIVYRITGNKYADDLSGTGAAMHGGRWNKKGSPVLYTGENKEIALLETIVHTPPMLIPNLDILILDICAGAGWKERLPFIGVHNKDVVDIFPHKKE